MSLIDPILTRVRALQSYVGSVAWGPFVDLSRNTILTLFKQIEVGWLEIEDTNGQITRCGVASNDDGTPKTTVRVHKDTFWARVLLFADMVRCILAYSTIRVGL